MDYPAEDGSEEVLCADMMADLPGIVTGDCSGHDNGRTRTRGDATERLAMEEAPKVYGSAREDETNGPVLCGQRMMLLAVKVCGVSSDLLTPD